MFRVADILAEIEHGYTEHNRSPSDGDILRWAAGSCENEQRLYDEIGAELARGYHVRRYSFEFCDRVVNDLYGSMIIKQVNKPSRVWPELFWRVYLAFDAGEHHSKPHADPVSEFTDPEIADIVRGLTGCVEGR
ncbi:hypothetical protein [Sphingomonas sp.]|uniref:hypothetical protein n=1 Tax=Sphingomonas sp. TaxID=28214 RepID=UPI0035C84037